MDNLETLVTLGTQEREPRQTNKQTNKQTKTTTLQKKQLKRRRTRTPLHKTRR